VSDLAQYFLSGLSVGCVTALVALGFVIIANVTGVYNFAQGEYVMVGGMVTAWSLTKGIPWPAAALLATAAGALVALVQERATVAPVRGRVGPLPLVVGSLGAAVVLRGAALLLWGRDPLRADPFTAGNFELLGARLSNQVLWVWGTTALALGATLLLFYRTHLGRSMRAVASSPRAARLVGIRVGPLSMGAFMLGGALTGLVGAVTVPLTLVSWDRGITVGLAGFVAAALAGFSSPWRAVAAGLALGVVEALSAGLVSSSYRLAFVYGVLLVYLLGADVLGADGTLRRLRRGRGRARAARSRPPRVSGGLRAVAERPARRWRLSRAALVPGLGLCAALAFPLLVAGARPLDAAVMALLLGIGATGLTLVMGLAGQLSLGQGAFYLAGGYCAAILTAKHGWGLMPALIAGVGLAAIVGWMVGWLTLRLRGFNLALATLAIHLILIVVVTEQAGLTGGELGTIGVPQFSLLGVDLSGPRDFYYVALAALVGTIAVARRVGASSIGLGLRALGADQDGAEALGVRTLRLKLAVFVIGSAMGGLGGVLWVYYVRFADPSTWGVALTIDLITFVVVGGLTSVYGGAVGAIAVQATRYGIGSLGLGDDLSQQVELILTGVLLVAFVLAFRGGLTGLGRRRTPMPPASGTPSAGASPAPTRWLVPLPDDRRPQDASPVLTVTGLTRRFGGFVAVDDVTLALSPGTITALVGPNGAGKSTVIGLLAGTLVPNRGEILLRGASIAGLPADEIARRGLTRTFQTPSLFEGLTVAETVRLARPRRGHDRRGAGAAALAALEVVGMAELADRPASSLSTGRQRLLDVARAIAAEPAVMLLDEPAAGLDDAETAALGELIVRISRAGTAVLLVEHAMGLVMSIGDHVVVLDQGRKIAEGPPGEVGRDERVVEAYLGTAIA
jgi:branched-chain amino acid transport system permease protein